MSKFKVGDKVVRSADYNSEIFLLHAGKKDYYTVTGVSSSGMWLQLDCKTREGDNYPWLAAYCELYQEPADELPPVPDREVYLNFKRDRGNDQRLVLDKDNGEGEGLMYIGVIPRKGSTRAQMEIGINIDPDSALQLAHDLRRMAMDIKRKEKAQ
jgi:hypothetical protein